MLPRRLLLRVLFASLALSAAAGAASILLGSSEVIWRVVSTGLTTAVAVGLLIPVTLLKSSDDSHHGPMLATTAIVVDFLLALVLIWDIAPSRNDNDWKIAFTMIFIAVITPPAILFLRFLTSSTTALAGRVGLLACIAEFSALLFATWTEFSYTSSERPIWEICGACAAFTPLAVAALIGITSPPASLFRRLIQWLGVACATIAFSLWTYAAIFHIHSHHGFFTCIVSTAAIIAYGNLAAFCPLKPSQRWIRFGAVGIVALTGILVDIIAIADIEIAVDSMLVRLAGATALVGSCATLALLILSRLNRRIDRPEDIARVITHIKLICPSCDRKAILPIGHSQCPTCGLLIDISTSEPRCITCGYSLLNLESPRCPECGTPVIKIAPLPSSVS